MEEVPRKRVKVVVLGDIGRSPRMQYHALSLAERGLHVELIGYADTGALPEVEHNKNITITKLYPLLFNAGPRTMQYALKAFWQTISLFLTLCVTGNCDYLLCQNPPAVPTLFVCRFYCLLTRTKFVIDWHNYAHTIMALSLPEGSWLLRLSTWMETWFGQSADKNICVTYAMMEDLMKNWNITAKVLYDKPPKMFQPMNLEDKHKWFMKIGTEYPELAGSGRQKLNIKTEDEVTRFTKKVQGIVRSQEDRPGLLFSSTSWTQDEDFKILLDALQVYETTYNLTKRLPKLICVITGKGPMKEHYIKEISSRQWQHIKVITPWLEATDYPRMVASADIGVCLHTSSSGLDLPMKVVDMFGAGLPVCAYDYKCLGELVEDSLNGYTFKNSDELAKQLVTWFEDFPNNIVMNEVNNKMRKELTKFQALRWEQNWNLRMEEIFDL